MRLVGEKTIYDFVRSKYGGVIILGVKEDKNGKWHTTGLKNASKLKKFSGIPLTTVKR